VPIPWPSSRSTVAMLPPAAPDPAGITGGSAIGSRHRSGTAPSPGSFTPSKSPLNFLLNACRRGRVLRPMAPT
jgi:hypothetical protein